LRMNPRRGRRSVAVPTPSQRRRTAASPRPGAFRRVRLGIAIQPPLLRDVIGRLIDRESDLEVVGEGRDEHQIGKMLGAENPELLLLDYEGFGPDADSIISRLRQRGPETRILVMSTGSSNEDVERVLRAGAWGLVAKRLEFETLLRAIRAVARGEIWANRSATALALDHLADPVPAGRPGSRMTKREMQVADGVTRGLRNKEIACELNIRERTVESHLNSIFQKLGVEGRFALALFEQGRSRLKS